MHRKLRIVVAVLLVSFGFAGIASVPASADTNVVNYGCMVSQNHETHQPSNTAPGRTNVGPLVGKTDGESFDVRYPNKAFMGGWGSTCTKGTSLQQS